MARESADRLRFLADEICDFAVVRALREAGHDVVAVVEISPRAQDTRVIRLAVEREHILHLAGLQS